MMNWTARKIRRSTLILTGLCTVVTLLLFARTHQKISNQSSKDEAGLGWTKTHRAGNDSQNHAPTRNTSRRDDASFMRRQALVQRQRLRQIRQTCRTRASVSLDKAHAYLMKGFVVNDRHRLLYCQVPKVASTSWLRVFLVLAGVLSHAGQGQQEFVHRQALRGLRTLDTYDGDQRRAILDGYTKVLFVRNPFTRVLSAFRSKLDASLADRQTRLWSGWLNRVRAYGGNRTAGGSGGGNQTDNTTVTFDQFVRFVSDPATSNNKHWQSVTRLCLPCYINYTFVGKLETLGADAEYLLKSARIDELVSLPGQAASSPTNSSTARVAAAYYARVPKEDIERMRVRFMWDFKLFGYRQPTDGLS